MKRALILVLAAAAPLAGCFQPAPVQRATAAQIGPILDNYSEAVIPQGGTIVLQGDDAIYGDFRHGRRPPINGADEKRGARTLADSLRRFVRHVTVVDHGFPGDTVEKSAERWAGQPVGNLLILSFGYGDFRAKTDVADYMAALTKLIKAAQAQGAAVFIVTTPPANSKKLSDIEDYRTAAKVVATTQGVDLFDSGAVLAAAKVASSNTEYGSAPIYQALAGALTPYIQVVPDPKAAAQAEPLQAEPPQTGSLQTGALQTGHSGSAGTRTVRVSADKAS